MYCVKYANKQHVLYMTDFKINYKHKDTPDFMICSFMKSEASVSTFYEVCDKNVRNIGKKISFKK